MAAKFEEARTERKQRRKILRSWRMVNGTLEIWHAATWQKTADECKSYRNVKLTYTVDQTSEQIDFDIIHNWLIWDNDAQTVDVVEDVVREYAAELTDTYTTIGKSRQFETSTGEHIDIQTGIMAGFSMKTLWHRICSTIFTRKRAMKESFSFPSVGMVSEMSILAGHTWKSVSTTSIFGCIRTENVYWKAIS